MEDADARRRTPLNFVAIYYALACGISWILWAPTVLGLDGLKWLNIQPSLPVVVCIGTAGPLIACYLTHRLQTGNWRAVRFFAGGPSRLVWLLLGPVLIGVCFFVVFPALYTQGGPAAWHWHPRALARILVPMFNYNLFGGPLFEEFGWRGFLQPRLQMELPPWPATIAVGILWATWHLPLFLVHWSSSTPLQFYLIIIGLSLVMAFCFNASGELVPVAILMHSAFNASPQVFSGYLANVPTREHPAPEWLLAVSFLAVGALLAVLTKGRLGCGSQLARLVRLRLCRGV